MRSPRRPRKTLPTTAPAQDLLENKSPSQPLLQNTETPLWAENRRRKRTPCLGHRSLHAARKRGPAVARLFAGLERVVRIEQWTLLLWLLRLRQPFGLPPPSLAVAPDQHHRQLPPWQTEGAPTTGSRRPVQASAKQCRTVRSRPKLHRYAVELHPDVDQPNRLGLDVVLQPGMCMVTGAAEGTAGHGTWAEVTRFGVQGSADWQL